MPMQINPYLQFPGTCEEAFRFYEKQLGGKIDAMMPHTGLSEENRKRMHMPEGWDKKIMHAHMTVAGTSIMASDLPPSSYKTPQGFWVVLNVTTVEEAERLYGALKEGGSVYMELQQTFFAQRHGSVFDRFGIPWMINCMA